MDILKQDLEKKQKKAYKIFIFSITLFLFAFLTCFYLIKPQEGSRELLISITLYSIAALICGIVYFSNLIKLKKEYDQKLAELENE